MARWYASTGNDYGDVSLFVSVYLEGKHSTVEFEGACGDYGVHVKLKIV